MQLIVAADAADAGARAAQSLAEALRAALASRELATLALSRLEVQSPALRALAQADLDWQRVHLFQVDERVVPAQDPKRNAWHLEQVLVVRGPLPLANWHPMPVEESDSQKAALAYQRALRSLCSSPPRLDAVHLGLGADGHTASLLPGTDALRDREHDVSFARSDDGQLRMTLTYPVLEAARHIVWLVTGEAKGQVLAQLIAGEGDAPAAHVPRAQAIVIADTAAARQPASQ